MTGIDKHPFGLAKFRQNSARLFARARDGSKIPRAAGAAKVSGLTETTAFGSNPGNLRMFVHVPEGLPTTPPLVVALHGCGQSAAEYAKGTGWTELADKHGFVVVLPQQQPSNNPNTCFSWFSSEDITRDQGEALSIRQMVEWAVAKFKVDGRRVFITGLSAGGAMTSTMLATYPETFAGGAIIAGLPHGSATSIPEAFRAMSQEQSFSVSALGDRVRSASPHEGPWPTISVWHGNDDATVKPSNAEHIVSQWVDVHGIAEEPTRSEMIGGHTRRVWSDATGATVIEALRIAGMGHGVPIDASPNTGAPGAPGAYFLDAGLSSTHHIALQWGLIEPSVATQNAAVVWVPQPERSDVGASDAAETAAAARRADRAAEQRSPAALDPSRVIAAAFKAAGLPVPQLPNASSAVQINPAAIIDAALKAAGVKK